MANVGRPAKTVHYRGAKLVAGPKGRDLQSLLSQALRKRRKVGERLDTLTGDEATHQFINRFSEQQSFLFGSLVLYADGTNKLTVLVDLDSEEISPQEVAPPQSKSGKRSEFLDSILYFAVHQNHVIVLQSSALRIKNFESHLLWLLRKADVIDKHAQMVLEESISQVTREQIKASHVKKVMIGQELESEPVTSEGGTRQKAVVKTIRHQPSGVAFDVISNLLKDNRWLEELQLEDSLDESKLHLTVEITYKHSTTEAAQKLLDKIATGLRHFDKDNVAIELKGGGTIKGDDLRVSGKIYVRTHNGVVDESDLYPKLREFLLEQLEHGTIPP
jgi:hypothetical protein